MKTSTSGRCLFTAALIGAGFFAGLATNQRHAPGATKSTAPASATKLLPEKSTVRLALQRRLGAEQFELRRIALPARLDDRVVIALGEEAAAPKLQLKRHSVRGENFRVLVAEPDGT